MKKHKIYLLYRGPQKEARDSFTAFVPSGLFNILFYLRKNSFDVELYNLSGFKAVDLRHFIRHNPCDAALISCFYGNHAESIKLARMIKAEHPGTLTVLGGPFAILGEEILRRIPELDFVIKGEGEISSLRLMRAIIDNISTKAAEGLYYRALKGIQHTPPVFHDSIDDFFYLPSEIAPYCHHVVPENFSILISSRGCPDRCIFCSSPALWKNRIRYHSIDLMVKYLKDLRQSTGALYFSIRDDNFLMNKRRVTEFSKKLAAEKLYYLWNTQGSARFIDDAVARALHESGCDQVQMGIESGSPALLTFLNKKIDLNDAKSAITALRRHLIRPFGYFIGGMNETSVQVKETTNFIRNSGVMDGVLSPLVIYPGTGLSASISCSAFFGKNEISYYSEGSYLKYCERYLEALSFAYTNNNFTINELAACSVYHYSTNITRHFHYLAKGDYPAAKAPLDEIITREPQNPWPYLLLSEVYQETGDGTKSREFLKKADSMLKGKNVNIKERLAVTR